MNKNIIIILMYNDWESTLDLLNSIKDYKALEKIIVVDNCSTNGSYEKIKEKESEHIHVIKTPANDGIAKGNNYGVQYAKRVCPDVENYIFSNPDVIVNEDSIVAMSDFLKNNSKYGAVCPFELTKEGDLAGDFAWRLPTYWQMIFSVSPWHTKLFKKPGKPYLWFYDTNEAIKQDVFDAEVIISCFIMISRVAYEAVGGFSERTFLYHEEDIIAHAFAERGIKLAVLTKYKITHLGCTSMNTTYSNWANKSKIMYDSSRIYMEDCLKASKLALWFYEIAYKVGIWQRALYRKILRKDL